MDFMITLLRLLLFGVFALAALGKLFDLEGAKKAFREFGAPERLTGFLSAALPIVEFGIAMSLLFVEASWAGSIAGLLLLLSFIGGMAWQISKGHAPDCHCFGQIHSEPVGKRSLIRNIILALFAGVLVLRGQTGQGTALANGDSNVMQTVLILIVAAICAATAFYLKKVFQQQTQILRRLEVLDLVSKEGVAVEREGVAEPGDSLPIGSPFPDFALPNLAGRTLTLENVISRGKPALFFFVSPTCGPCSALLPDIKKWQGEFQGKVEFVLISSGTAAANAEKYGGDFSGDVLLQAGGEVSDVVRARWTPTALFVRRDGTIASHVAAGDNAIRDLIEKIRSEDVDHDLFYVANGDNMKIGEPVPEFSLETPFGKRVTSDQLKGRRTLAVFWSQVCPYCLKMIEDLKSWDEGRAESEPDLLVFAAGEPEDHMSIGLKSPIVMDFGLKTAENLGMSGTPSAVLIDVNGRIVTETAVGAENIWALIGRYNSRN